MVITRLVDLLEADRIKAPTARATIYWLVGQFAPDGLLSTVAPDTIRLGAIGFATESILAKLQLLNASAKCLIAASVSKATTNYKKDFEMLFDYLTTLARYDLVYEVRDRARFLKGIVGAAGVGPGENGKSRIGLGEEDFKNGVLVDDIAGSNGADAMDAGEKSSLTIEQARVILFDGKAYDTSQGSSYLIIVRDIAHRAHNGLICIEQTPSPPTQS